MHTVNDLTELETVAVINKEGEPFKGAVIEHQLGIDRLPVGTEPVDRAHVIRLISERDALQQRLNAADQRIDELSLPVLGWHVGGNGFDQVDFLYPQWANELPTGGRPAINEIRDRNVLQTMMVRLTQS